MSLQEISPFQYFPKVEDLRVPWSPSVALLVERARSYYNLIESTYTWLGTYVASRLEPLLGLSDYMVNLRNLKVKTALPLRNKVSEQPAYIVIIAIRFIYSNLITFTLFVPNEP